MDANASTSLTQGISNMHLQEDENVMEMSTLPNATSYSADRSMEVGIGKYGGLQPSFARVTEASQDEQGFYGKSNIYI
jgi:hypothetical protein